MGRKSLLEALDITVHDLWAHYCEVASLEETAKYFSCSERVLRSYFRKAGFGPLPPGPKPCKNRSVPPTHRGCVADFIREHPDVKLPRSLQDIATVTGCSYAAVNGYFVRRRRFVREEVRKLPALIPLQIALPDPRGRLINSRYFVSYAYVVDPFTFDVVLKTRLSNGAALDFRFILEDLIEIIEASQEDS